MVNDNISLGEAIHKVPFRLLRKKKWLSVHMNQSAFAYDQNGCERALDSWFSRTC